MRSEIAELVRRAGVVGAGGAGFPTHVKLSSAAETVIINGAECEPLLRVDQQLMAVEAGNVVKGLVAVMEATGAKTGIIALKAKYKAAIAALEPVVYGKPVKVFLLQDFFPAGDEQVLVYEVTGRAVPEGGIPLAVGCVVCNVETVLNVAAAMEGIPVTDTYVTLTGDVAEPVTVRAAVGTMVSELLALAGVKDSSGVRVIDGGPMMGSVLDNLEVPVTKTSKGFIILPAQHPLINNKTLSLQSIVRRSKSACIQCAMCTEICPRSLLGHRLYPHKIMRGLNHLTSSDDAMKNALLCCECGACELYGCPMLLSPRTVNGALKKEFAKQGIKLSLTGAQSPVAAVRDFRKIPSKRLAARLGLTPYDRPAPLAAETYSPDRVVIPLRQHIGAPALPVVEQGQRVEKGDLIGAIPEGALGAAVHAGISGTVVLAESYIVIESDRKRGGH